MCFEKDEIYPDCPTVVRTIEIGGLTKSQLLQKLQQNSILINRFGERLFVDDKFKTSDVVYSVKTVELKIRNLGFPKGATLSELYRKANQVGLKLCPLELGSYLRLKFLDQPEGFVGKPIWKDRSPYGTVKVASEVLYEDDDFPKGFYLRKIDGVLWLRGYISYDLHVLDPDDHIVFCLS